MYYRDRRHKTQDYRDWELATLQAMNSPFIQQEMQKIREAFNAETSAFSVRLTALYPAPVLFNKQGTISSRAEDLTNWEKPIVDLLFLPKIHVQPQPYGCPNINADDKYILSLHSAKKVSKDAKHYIRVSIAIVPLPKPV